jgi:hypothetical protein
MKKLRDFHRPKLDATGSTSFESVRAVIAMQPCRLSMLAGPSVAVHLLGGPNREFRKTPKDRLAAR